MAVDLRSNSLFQRSSLLLDADCLIRLEHGYTKDRVRRIMFDRVAQVIVFRRIPAVPIALSAIFLGGPGLLLLLPGGAAIVAAIIFLLLCAIAVSYYLICRKTTIRIIRAGKTDDITGIFSPRKVRRLVVRMVANIQATQQTGHADLAQKQAAAAAATAAAEDTAPEILEIPPAPDAPPAPPSAL